MHVYMYTCLVSHHEQLTLIGQSKISKCGSKPLAITGWPGAENNTRAGPTAAWIMGVYFQRDMGLAGIGFANLRNLRCEQVWKGQAIPGAIPFISCPLLDIDKGNANH